MSQVNWKIDTLANITAEEFFTLIDRNREHIKNAFPLTLAGCADLKKTKKYIEQSIDNETWEDNYYFYIRHTNTKALIGYLMIKNIDGHLSKCELAYFIDKDFEGKGIISNALNDVLDFCFGQLNHNKVFISTSLTNVASQKIALKHGFLKEGVLRQEFMNGEGKLEDIMYFGLLKSEYKH
jgi:ribosomal-protein-serine acetyltransferase